MEKILTVTVEEVTPSSSRSRNGFAHFRQSASDAEPWVCDRDGTRSNSPFHWRAVRGHRSRRRAGDIAFEYGPDLYVLHKGASEAQKFELVAAADEKQTTSGAGIIYGRGAKRAFAGRKNFLHSDCTETFGRSNGKAKGIAAKNAEYATRSHWAGDDSDFSRSKDGKNFTSLRPRVLHAHLRTPM